MKGNSVKKLVYTSVCAALCVVLPLAFHSSVPNAGVVLLPMHIPVLLCGLICGWPFGLICGAVGPLLASVITSMPPVAVMPSMMVECAVYGLICGVMMELIRTRWALLDLYISMLTAMLIGRIVAGFANAWIFSSGTAPFAWVTTSLVQGIPGIAIQLALIPVLVYSLQKARLVPERKLAVKK